MKKLHIMANLIESRYQNSPPARDEVARDELAAVSSLALVSGKSRLLQKRDRIICTSENYRLHLKIGIGANEGFGPKHFN